MKPESIKEFFAFMKMRHRIYLDRKAGKPYPWTTDPVLLNYRFCNIYRELDIVTVWIRKNWRMPWKDHPNLPFAMAVARQINWPETLMEMGFPNEWERSVMLGVLKRRKKRGEKIYTGAYMLTGTLGGTKIEQTINKILTPLYNTPVKIYKDSLRETWRGYLDRPGFAKFMAYEVVSDLRHTKHLRRAKDVMRWANAGPGAMRGLNRLHKQELRIKWREEDAVKDMRFLLEMSKKHWPNNKEYPALEMREIEHSLCEFDKYERTLNGEGRPRSKYEYTT